MSMVLPVLDVNVSAPVPPLATAVTPVWLDTALIAAATLLPCVATLLEPATAPTLTPLMTKSPDCSDWLRSKGLETELVTTVEAEADTPV